MIDFKRYDKAVIVSGYADFHCLIKHLQQTKKLQTALVPSTKNCSILIKKIVCGDLSLISDLRKKLEYKKGSDKRKKPHQDKTGRDTFQS